ncbi:MAG: noncanonical pyrimidine nucleotidase, YjjG family [Lachnospiraceae bacterium]|nr:noncanonical pyrimidine nucleotidase, YjjG family [Lachnospiraceae bacterium]
MKKYEIILWDVDQTLLDFTKSEDYALRHAFEQFGRSIDTEIVKLYSGINDSYWKRLERGEVTRQEVIYGRFRSLFQELSVEDITAEEFAPVFQKALGSVYFYKDDSYRLCQELQKDFRQYVVTNGVTWTQQNKLKLAGFDKVMEDIFISEMLGCDKPGIEFFDKCFERIPDFNKEKTIIVGDSLTSDMLGGNNAGIACCWYNPEGKERTGTVRIDHEITDLWDIREVLNG